jgi:hypothetical protein
MKGEREDVDDRLRGEQCGAVSKDVVAREPL